MRPTAIAMKDMSTMGIMKVTSITTTRATSITTTTKKVA